MKRTYILCAAISVWVCGHAWGVNLLANPGFETLERDMPARWQVFVMPMDGAHASLDNDHVYEGQYSVRLHNPREYDKEPANNWSQNLLENLGGKDIIISGFIRTQDTTEAAIWVQCCMRRPWRVLKFETTSTDSPVYGTRSWTPVSMRITVPEATDFVTIRCVLKGRGTAWFDNISVRIAEDTIRDQSTPHMAQGTAQSHKTLADRNFRDAVDALLEYDMEHAAPDDGQNPPPVDTELARALVDAHNAILEINAGLRHSNRSLSEEIAALRRQISELREAIRQQQNDAVSLQDQNDIPPVRSTPDTRTRSPVLVPKGYPLTGYDTQ